jgi:hypothetical protein
MIDEPMTGLRLEEGVCYLVKEKKAELSFRLFELTVANGAPGLCITRQYPARVVKSEAMKQARVIWLSHTPGEDYHNPAALGSLTKIICSFIEEKGECVVLVDGFEYLMVNNGFQNTLLFVEHLNEFVMPRKGIVILPVSPEALDEKELALLERNLEVLESPMVRTVLDSSELSRLIDTY